MSEKGKNILFAWELGGDLGHITRFLPIANRLQRQGHQVTFVLRDISRAERIVGKYGHRLLQAPMWLPPSRTAPSPPVSYAEILQHYGYLSVSGLIGVVKAWRTLLELTVPDLVVFDFAPTAMLASRGLSFKTAAIGTGFCLPPKEQPLPSFLKLDDPRKQIMGNNEDVVLSNINKALGLLGIEPLHALHQLFDVDQQFLCTLPELDHFPSRTGEDYWGVDIGDTHTKKPKWQNTGKPKIFGYLKHQYPGKEALLRALSQVDGDTIVYSPDLSATLVKQYESDRLTFIRTPLSYKAVMSTCDLVVFHAGHGTAAAAHHFNRPTLCAPLHNEQAIVANNLEKLGNSKTVKIEDDVATIGEKINNLLKKSYKSNLGACLTTAGVSRPFQPAEAIEERCVQLLL